MAEALAAAGIGRGDRVGIALPNGLPMIVAFLAASMAGTAAPLNPGLQGRRVPLLPRRHRGAACCCCRPTAPTRRGARPAIACRSLTVEMDAGGNRAPAPASAGRRSIVAAGGRRRRADPAHERQHRPAQARAALARQPVDLGDERRAQLRARPGRRVAVRDAALPRARPRGLDARDARDRRHGGRARQVQSAVVLARRARSRRHLVFGRADDAPAAAGARRGGDRPGPPAPKACASSDRAARRCRRR